MEPYNFLLFLSPRKTDSSPGTLLTFGNGLDIIMYENSHTLIPKGEYIKLSVISLPAFFLISYYL